MDGDDDDGDDDDDNGSLNHMQKRKALTLQPPLCIKMRRKNKNDSKLI